MAESAVQNPSPTPASSPGGRRWRDLAYSLIALLIPVILIIVAYRVLYGGDTVVTVDPTPRVESAQRAGLSPLPPTTAPAGWQTIAAQFQDGTLRLGFLGPDSSAVSLVDSKTAADTLIGAELTSDGAKVGETVVDGRTWERWTGRDGEEALVLRPAPGGTGTVILVGKGGDLDAFAAWLA